MSYILDALRKADSQRSRDPARGIHAQPVTATATASGHVMKRRRERQIWCGAAAVILAAAVSLWASGRHGDAPGNGVSNVGGTPANAPPVVIVPAPLAPPPAAVILPGPPPVVRAPLPAVPEVRRAVVPVAKPEAPVAVAAVAPVNAPAAAVAADKIYTVAELPADVQQAFPKLSISGGVYSDNVAQRMLIVNGQVFNEGSEIAPGVVLQQLRAKTAVLKFRGLTVSQPY